MVGFDRPPFAPNVGGALTIPHLPIGGIGSVHHFGFAMALASTTSILPRYLQLRVISPDFVREASLPHMLKANS